MTIAILKAILPFLKELLFGDSDLKQHIRRNKLATFFIFANAAMFVLFLFVSEQVLKTRAELNEKRANIAQLEDIIKAKDQLINNQQCKPQPVVVTPKPAPITGRKPARSPVPEGPKPIPPENDLKTKLNAIRKNEEDLE